MLISRTRLNEAPFRAKLTDIRAVGLMIGIDLAAPDAKRVLMESLEHSLLLSAIGDHTLRIVPPLNVTQADIDEAMTILRRLCEKRKLSHLPGLEDRGYRGAGCPSGTKER